LPFLHLKEELQVVAGEEEWSALEESLVSEECLALKLVEMVLDKEVLLSV
jgi:hypothetical protein